MYEEVREQARQAVEELLSGGYLHRGDLLVIGCSSSEIVGGQIGKESTLEAAEQVFEGVYPLLKEQGIWLAGQCCEHLNRALVVERELADRRQYTIVAAVPHPKAGGSFATTCYARFEEPVLVEEIRAEAGLDIGSTLIGMHLKAVAVPLRLSVRKIGSAALTAAYTRPKFIGGCRTQYQ